MGCGAQQQQPTESTVVQEKAACLPPRQLLDLAACRNNTNEPHMNSSRFTDRVFALKPLLAQLHVLYRIDQQIMDAFNLNKDAIRELLHKMSEHEDSLEDLVNQFLPLDNVKFTSITQFQPEEPDSAFDYSQSDVRDPVRFQMDTRLIGSMRQVDLMSGSYQADDVKIFQ